MNNFQNKNKYNKMNEHYNNYCDYTDCKYCVHHICDCKNDIKCQRIKDKEAIMNMINNTKQHSKLIKKQWTQSQHTNSML